MRRTLLAVTALLAGCVTLDNRLRAEHGAHVDHTLAVLGAATRTVDRPDGGKAYTWVRQQGDASCTITLEADRNGFVRGHAYEGDAPPCGDRNWIRYPRLRWP
jgi:hypothetical protein